MIFIATRYTLHTHNGVLFHAIYILHTKDASLVTLQMELYTNCNIEENAKLWKMHTFTVYRS